MIPEQEHRAFLLRLARNAMAERGLEPDFAPAALAQADAVTPLPRSSGLRDLRDLLWCSIDNDDSRDLDQLTVALGPDHPDTDAPGQGRRPEGAAGAGGGRLLVAVADVSAVVEDGSPIDAHARANTVSVYTPPRNFPMLPDRLSSDLTSLIQDEDRLAVVADLTIDGTGETVASSLYRAVVRNKAKLTYARVGAWLEEEKGAPPKEVAAVPGLTENLRLQDGLARLLHDHRHEHGALDLDTIEPRARFEGDTVTGITAEERNRAKELIEDAMIAANGATARYLEERRFPIVRRVVRAPERWDRIADLAHDLGEELPAAPDAKALHEFLVRRRAADPLRFPDLSLAIVKLLGRGEYVASFPGDGIEGHFGLAVSEYTHSTAPNRRYPDLITQRLLRAALDGGEPPYGRDELTGLAERCTRKQDDAQKVERLLRKAAAALLLGGRIGEVFDGLVTGAAAKGTWVRVFDPPVEGRIEHGADGLDVGDRVHVKLIRTDPERGYIDFARIGHRAVGRRNH